MTEDEKLRRRDESAWKLIHRTRRTIEGVAEAIDMLAESGLVGPEFSRDMSAEIQMALLELEISMARRGLISFRVKE